MPLLKNDNDATVEQGGQFLSFQDKSNKVIILSNVYQLNTHFLKTDKKVLVCKGKGCLLCQQGEKKNQGYYYLVNLNDMEGILRLPVGVFLYMVNWEAEMGEDKRTVAWTIVREGTGLETKYSVIPGKKAEEVTAKSLEENNTKLNEVVGAFEEKASAMYTEMFG